MQVHAVMVYDAATGEMRDVIMEDRQGSTVLPQPYVSTMHYSHGVAGMTMSRAS